MDERGAGTELRTAPIDRARLLFPENTRCQSCQPDGTSLAVDGRSGQRITAVDAAQALASARQFDAGVAAQYRGQVTQDPWNHSRALDSDRPLHRVQLDDAAGSLLYISSQTGAMVRDASRSERLWNWLGAWLHWLYPLRSSPWWAQEVLNVAPHWQTPRWDFAYCLGSNRVEAQPSARQRLAPIRPEPTKIWR